jgi:hypothetical protein
MTIGRIGARAALAVVGVLVSVMVMATPSWAAGGTKLCMPPGGNLPVLTPNSKGQCLTIGGIKYKLVELGAEGKQDPAGPTGEKGERGPTGVTGTTGPSGKNGENGLHRGNRTRRS